ncbi:hypothetical protein ABZU75_42890 [Streptosporangium sp. NPDC005286]|uniref:hypothetical protein n=1 Tax=Streptosporangium sp. NPDC005286 TaxID=3154463 RepID=UPI0033A41741
MSPRVARYLLGVAVAALTALAIGTIVGGSASSTGIAGLSDAGAAIARWGLPLAKLLADLAAAATAGALVAAILLPSDKGMLSPTALPYIRAASWAALSWAIATAVVLLLTLSDVLAVPAGRLRRAPPRRAAPFKGFPTVLTLLLTPPPSTSGRR